MPIALSQCPGIDPVKDSSAALQAALSLKQPIIADCPVNVVMGQDYTKGIFVPDGSDVTFTPQGRFDVNCFGFPAFTFMHAAGIWRGTNIRYTGGTSVVMPTAAGAWTNGPAKTYLEKNGYNTVFNGVGGTWWTGPSNSSALISVRGASNVTLEGGQIYVDAGATPDQFAYIGVGIDLAFVPGEICTPTAALVAPKVTVSDFLLDGVCMGFVGGGSNVIFTRITRRRYADLQDANGQNVGGVGTWSSPPHLFYLQGSPINPMVATLRNVVDEAIFSGNRLSPRYLHSLKLDISNGSLVDGYYSRCVDGGLGVLSNGCMTGGMVRNAFFLVDTSIKDPGGHQSGAPGLFFPSSHPYPASDITVSIANRATDNPIQGVPTSCTVQATTQTGYAG